MSNYKLDIFKLMNEHLDKGDMDVWNTLTDEEKKGFSALIVQRWMSCCHDQQQIINLNDYVNSYVFELGKHPELLMKLLAVASSKQSKRYKWMKQVSKVKEKKMTVKIIQESYGYSWRKAHNVVNLFSKEDIIEMAEDLGYQKDEIQKLKKELKD